VSPPDVVPPTYTPEEEATLSENLLAVTAAVYRGDTRGRPLRPELLCALHDSLFRGVREHAGRMRGHGFGSEVLRFGPWYSAHRHDVQKKIEALCAEVRRALDEITDAPEAPDYEDAALRLALTAHAYFIRIHPFEDGNGRTGRLLLSHLLVSLGLQPVPFEASRAEYIQVLEHFFTYEEVTPLLDLYLRLAADALADR